MRSRGEDRCVCLGMFTDAGRFSPAARHLSSNFPWTQRSSLPFWWDPAVATTAASERTTQRQKHTGRGGSLGRCVVTCVSGETSNTSADREQTSGLLFDGSRRACVGFWIFIRVVLRSTKGNPRDEDLKSHEMCKLKLQEEEASWSLCPFNPQLLDSVVWFFLPKKRLCGYWFKSSPQEVYLSTRTEGVSN